MRARFLIGLATVIALGAARSAAADTVIVEWIGDFAIPDIAPPPGVFIDIEVKPHPEGEDIIRDLDFGLYTLVLAHGKEKEQTLTLKDVDKLKDGETYLFSGSRDDPGSFRLRSP